LLRTIDVVTIQGNQDREIYQASQADLRENLTLAYAVSELGPEPIAWLALLPKTQLVSDEVFLCHGSPSSDTVYLLEDIGNGFPLVKTEEAILKELARVSHSIVLCGHAPAAGRPHVVRHGRRQPGQRGPPRL
jgi:diadenosine tetraphosphatase ApaH/serine/threonine PP2A family protein phosphatase